MTKKMPAQLADPAKLESIKQHIAHRIWEDEGRPEGRSEEHWLAACNFVDAMIANTAELPAWLRRVEQPSEAEEMAAQDASLQSKGEGSSRFQDVARRFARGT